MHSGRANKHTQYQIRWLLLPSSNCFSVVVDSWLCSQEELHLVVPGRLRAVGGIPQSLGIGDVDDGPHFPLNVGVKYNHARPISTTTSIPSSVTRISPSMKIAAEQLVVPKSIPSVGLDIATCLV
jgi:hypothetical protein